MTFSSLAAHARIAEQQRAFRRIDADHHARREKALRGDKKIGIKPLPYAVRQMALGHFETVRKQMPYCAASREFYRFAREDAPAAIADWSRRQTEVSYARASARDVLDQNSSDAKVRAWAHRRAGQAGALAARYVNEDEAFTALVTYTGGFGVEPARPLRDGAVYVTGAVRRMCTAKWWRSRARVMLSWRIERAEVLSGSVHCKAGVYLSDRNVARGIEAAQRNADTLERTEAVNELGEVFNLGELAEKSLSNPRIAFAEMMVRVKGLEEQADKLDWPGSFITWSLPSRFHARLHKSGARNPNHDRASLAREGQQYLSRQWAKVRATLKRKAVEFFGMRVAEPHHDGTPHWHMLIWTAKRWHWLLSQVLHKFALQESPDEKGAAAVRLKYEMINKAKGTAAGYLVKYVAKNTCADGLERALDTDDKGRNYDLGIAADKALRARLWARNWRIRQFQFFGAPPIGIYREFRKLREPVTVAEKPTWSPTQLDLFERARGAADESRYGDFVAACGGIGGRRFELFKVDAGDNVYGEPGREVVKGIVFSAGGTPVVTRVHEWTILQGAKSAEPAAPWTRTRVSNCNGGEKPQGVMYGDEEKSGEENGCSKGQGDRYRTHGSGRGDHAYSPPPRRQEDDGRAGR